MYKQISGPTGFSTAISLSSQELARIRYFIHERWLERIKSVAPECANQFKDIGIDQYHSLSHLVDQNDLWTREVRILSSDAADEIRKMEFFGKLENSFGTIIIPDITNAGHEEFIWRIQKPNEIFSIQPIHADQWFWELEKYDLDLLLKSKCDKLGLGAPKDLIRIKFWVGIYMEPGLSGLLYIPGSHLKEWVYGSEIKKGRFKSIFDPIKNKADDPILLLSEPGKAFVFHDKLLHGGALNKGKNTRVSLEFTMFVKP